MGQRTRAVGANLVFARMRLVGARKASVSVWAKRLPWESHASLLHGITIVRWMDWPQIAPALSNPRFGYV